MKKNFLPMVLFPVMVTGCEMSHIEEAVLVSGPNLRPEEFHAAAPDFSNDRLRTSLGADNAVLWTSGDELSVFRKNTEMDRFLLKTGSGTSQATFSLVEARKSTGNTVFSTGEVLQDNLAIYPYSPDYTVFPGAESYRISGVQFPAVQTYSSGSFSGKNFPMFALSRNSGLAFSNLCGVMEIRLTGSSAVKSLLLQGNNGERLSGMADISVGRGILPFLEMLPGSGGTVLLDCGDGIRLSSEPTSFMIVLPPVTLEKGFTLEVEDTDGKIAVFKAGAVNTIIRNRILVMPAKEFLPQSPPTDLSAAGTANSYIIHQSGNYRFKAGVKGNGNVLPVAGSSSPVLSGLSSADLLWQASGDGSSLDGIPLVTDLTLSGDEIRFKVPSPFVEGNAVISVRDESGTIKWSWHLWMVGDAISENVHTNGKGTLMDRNLGAVSAASGEIASTGLLYQWGRKDPFLGSGSIASPTVFASVPAWPQPVVVTEETGTVDYAVSHPAVFLSAGPAKSSPSLDWLYMAGPDADNTRWGDVKTIYDPCPPGWKVPEGGSSGIWYNVENMPASFDTRHYGVLFPSAWSGGETWYPACGYRDSEGQLISVGNAGSCWSSTPVSYTGHGSEAFFLSYDQNNYIYPDEYGVRSEARSVRCSKIL